ITAQAVSPNQPSLRWVPQAVRNYGGNAVDVTANTVNSRKPSQQSPVAGTFELSESTQSNSKAQPDSEEHEKRQLQPQSLHQKHVVGTMDATSVPPAHTSLKTSDRKHVSVSGMVATSTDAGGRDAPTDNGVLPTLSNNVGNSNGHRGAVKLPGVFSYASALKVQQQRQQQQQQQLQQQREAASEGEGAASPAMTNNGHATAGTRV
ncbi:hypothetical protein BGZ99_005236, partial [Dissophora globulifera]